MQVDFDHIRQLVIEEIAGTISETDAAWLQQTIAESAEAWVLYTQLRQELDTVEMRNAQEALAQTLTVEKVLADIKNKRRTRYIVSVAGIAAVLIMVVGAYTLFISRTPQQDMVAQAPEQRIELQLANGKIVDLSTEKQQVQVGTLTLNNAQKTLSYSSQSGTGTPAGWATLNVPVGKDYKVQLSDGTEVWLNAATRLQFPFNFNGKTREVTINGEAYLKVAKNTQQPFIVHLPHSTVQVLGTAFNVNTYDSGQIKVSLVEGSVRMQTQRDSRMLKPGYEINYDLKRGMQVASFEATETLSWQKGIYFFDDAPLEEVCRVIPRWFGIKVVMDNQEVARKHFTGSIDRNKPVQTSLEHLKATNLIDYYFDNNSVLHIK